MSLRLSVTFNHYYGNCTYSKKIVSHFILHFSYCLVEVLYGDIWELKRRLSKKSGWWALSERVYYAYMDRKGGHIQIPVFESTHK